MVRVCFASPIAVTSAQGRATWATWAEALRCAMREAFRGVSGKVGRSEDGPHSARNSAEQAAVNARARGVIVGLYGEGPRAEMLRGALQPCPLCQSAHHLFFSISAQGQVRARCAQPGCAQVDDEKGMPTA